ncbi:pentapeptide repeat-containing protein [uncultured Deinococcus sp.]|uniref:pentapeptide repeat-containing protein n=1 Tax=uncultured Deinococcus sp. TaxID=158789 RepID=UPI0025F37BB5|nr:pentapeptide repeat-containing protein [uncultured Deinococcus sp.]
MTSPHPPRFPRGGLRALEAAALEPETTYRGVVIEGGRVPSRLHAVALEGCVLRGTDLRDVDWTLVRLADVRLEDCDLSAARLTDAALTRVEIRGGRLLGTQLPQVVIKDVRLTGVTAPFSLWNGAQATRLHARDCDLTDAVFTGAALPGAVLRGCVLTRTDVHRATLTGADLRHSDLRGIALGLPELAGVTVDEGQLVALARFLGVTVAEPPLDDPQD